METQSQLSVLLRDALATAETALSKIVHGEPDPLEPETRSDPIEHGVVFSRRVLEVEDGAKGELLIDHGCRTTDEYGDNQCQFVHGDTVHVTLHYNLAKPLVGGALYINGETQIKGVGGIVQNMLRRGGGKGGGLFVAQGKPIEVACDLCEPFCNTTLFGKPLSLKLAPCPLPAGQDITLLDADIELPKGSFLALVKGTVTGKMTIKRSFDFEDTTLFEATASLSMARLQPS